LNNYISNNSNNMDPALSGNTEGVAVSEERKPLDMTTSASDSLQQQNITFDDAVAGHGDSRGNHIDPIRDHIMAQDVGLGDFFSRPLKVHTAQWTPGNSLDFTINPWTLFWENPRVINRVVNYRLLRCTMKIKVVINGNPFYYGRAICSYVPLPGVDDLTTLRGGVRADLVGASQKPHIYLDPTCSQGGELELPFFTPSNVLDITTSEWQTMGYLQFASLNDLKHANGSTDPITLAVFAWAENVSMAIPTQTEPTTLVAQSFFSKMNTSDERVGIISKPMSTVAKAAGLVKKLPPLAPFATATEIGAGAIATLASLFGFSKPSMDVNDGVIPVSKTSLAACDGPEVITKLTVDSKQEVSIDPRIGGIDVPDELPILHYATRETYLETFDWAMPGGASGPEDLLWNCVVDPGLHRIYNNGSVNELHMTAAHFACLPFEFWKGTIRFRFQVVASQYHKGRIKIVYDPVMTPASGASEYNTAYTTIIDISEEKDFVVDCGWGQNTPWRRHFRATEAEANMFATTPLTYDSRTDTEGNGTIAVYIVNDLTSPDSVVDNDIQINVFVSALDDFEVAAPTAIDLRYLRVFHPEADDQDLDPQSTFESAPYGAQIKGDMGEESPTDGTLNKIYFGEVICSFRQLLKRYNLHEILIPISDFDTFDRLNFQTFQRTAMPFDTGYSPNSPFVDFGRPTAFTEDWVNGFTPLISYIKWAHAGWRGGVRYHLDSSNFIHADTNYGTDAINVNSNEASWSLGRLSNEVNQAIVNAVDAGDYNTSTAGDSHLDLMERVLSWHEDATGHAGVTRWNTRVNPQHSYEIPFYSDKRFLPGRQRTKWFSIRDPMFVLDLVRPSSFRNDSSHFFHYVSAAEDWTPLFFLGAPPLYFTTTYTPAP
jgi:hypothetical protein